MKKWFFLLPLCFYVGCAGADDPATIKKIDSFEAVEKEVLNVEKTVREKDAKERLYQHFYNHREELLLIAQGKSNSSNSTHRALIREAAWMILAEVHQRKPDFKIEIKVEPEPQPKPQPPKPKPEIDEDIDF